MEEIRVAITALTPIETTGRCRSGDNGCFSLVLQYITPGRAASLYRVEALCSDNSVNYRWRYREKGTIPPAKPGFCYLPLHKGGVVLGLHHTPLPLGEDVAGTELHNAERGGKDRYKAGKEEYPRGNCDRHRREVICEVYGLAASYVKDGT